MLPIRRSSEQINMALTRENRKTVDKMAPRQAKTTGLDFDGNHLLSIMNKIVKATILTPQENSFLLDFVNFARSNIEAGKDNLQRNSEIFDRWEKLTKIIDAYLSINKIDKLSYSYLQLVEEKLGHLTALQKRLACQPISPGSEFNDLHKTVRESCLHKLRLNDLQVKYKAAKFQSLLKDLKLSLDSNFQSEANTIILSSSNRTESKNSSARNSQRDAFKRDSSKNIKRNLNPNSQTSINVNRNLQLVSKIEFFIRNLNTIDERTVSNLCESLKNSVLLPAVTKNPMALPLHQQKPILQGSLPVKSYARSFTPQPNHTVVIPQNAENALRNINAQLSEQLKFFKGLSKEIKLTNKESAKISPNVIDKTSNLSSSFVLDKSSAIFKQILSAKLKIERALGSDLSESAEIPTKAEQGPGSQILDSKLIKELLSDLGIPVSEDWGKNLLLNFKAIASKAHILTAIKQKLRLSEEPSEETLLNAISTLQANSEAFELLKRQTPSIFLAQANERESIDMDKVRQLTKLNSLVEQNIQRNQSFAQKENVDSVGYLSDLIDKQRIISEVFLKSASANIYELPKNSFEKKCKELGEELNEIDEARRIFEKLNESPLQGSLPEMLSQTLGALSKKTQELESQLKGAEDENTNLMNKFLAYQEELYNTNQNNLSGLRKENAFGDFTKQNQFDLENSPQKEEKLRRETEGHQKETLEDLGAKVKNQKREIQTLETKINKMKPVFTLLSISAQDGDLLEKAKLRLFELGVTSDKLAHPAPKSSKNLLQTEFSESNSKLTSELDKTESISLHSAERPLLSKTQVDKEAGNHIDRTMVTTSNSFKTSADKNFHFKEISNQGAKTPTLSTKLFPTQ